MTLVTRFLSKAERITKAKAEQARQLILGLALPETATEDILITLNRHETGGRLAQWNFNMLNPSQCLAIWNAIRLLPADARPQQLRHLFDLIITHIETNTGAVTLTREELAEQVGTAPENISRLMGTFEEMGVIRRRRIKVAGMRGCGIARYYINPHVAWNGSLEVRKEQAAQQQALPFGVIEGGLKA